MPGTTLLHAKCRFPNEYSYRSGPDIGAVTSITRFEVPDDRVDWDVIWEAYEPIPFTAPFVFKAPWADPKLDDRDFEPRWNEVDGKVNRKSHEGIYRVHDGIPLNVCGRTGLRGRGVLGRFGPNHAADPIVTRWKRADEESGDVVRDLTSGKPVLQFVAIQRKDTGEWAIPGGMVDPGETVSQTVKREFMEEALDATGSGKANFEQLKLMVNDFFESQGREVYRGYVDDPRNTDNSWMETVAFLFHDDKGDTIGTFPLKCGDDAKDLKWIDISSELNLYASHADFIRKAAELVGAHWD